MLIKYMSERLSLLRSRMTELGVNAYFLPHSDPHNSEYLSDHDKRVEFISGFKGSNGHLLITQDQAMLWTDGRYWLAAEKQLYENWTLMKMTSGVPSYFEWAVQNLPKNSSIGYDPKIITADAAKNRAKYFEEKGYEFKGVNRNPINDVWENRPELSLEPIFVHDLQYAGETVIEKLRKVTESIQSRYYLVTALDDIAWLLNLRGQDIAYNPVFFAYVLIEKLDNQSKIHLFINETKVLHLTQYLNENSVEIHPYESISDFVALIDEEITVDSSVCNYDLFLAIKKPLSLSSIVTDLKSIKNPREIQGFKDCHVRDGLAVCKYLAWLRQQLDLGNEYTEHTAAIVLEQYRRSEDLNMGLSFETISSVGPNAAVIHYKPEPESAAVIVKNQIYLLDSGGHYQDGTTDTTRTLHFGEPTAWERECYTRVLLGNLDLERITWPQGSWKISGAELDVLARRRLWQKGLDYQHGTGHGVGYFLNVHEGPQGISRYRKTELKEGMNVTNEPGYYEAGSFGIRIENVMFVTKNPNIEHFLSFENVTMVPYDKNLIDSELLNSQDKEYINAYHRKVWETHAEVLRSKNDELTLAWLHDATSPLE